MPKKRLRLSNAKVGSFSLINFRWCRPASPPIVEEKSCTFIAQTDNLHDGTPLWGSWSNTHSAVYLSVCFSATVNKSSFWSIILSVNVLWQPFLSFADRPESVDVVDLSLENLQVKWILVRFGMGVIVIPEYLLKAFDIRDSHRTWNAFQSILLSNSVICDSSWKLSLCRCFELGRNSCNLSHKRAVRVGFDFLFDKHTKWHPFVIRDVSICSRLENHSSWFRNRRQHFVVLRLSFRMFWFSS